MTDSVTTLFGVSGEGPCIDSVLDGELVCCSDVTDDERWPALASESADAGIGGVLGVPIRLGGVTVGALNVYTDGPHEWTDSEVGAVAAFDVLRSRARSERRRVADVAQDLRRDAPAATTRLRCGVRSPEMSHRDITPGPASDPHARSWVRGADASDFPLQNLPYGSCRGAQGEPFLAVRIGDCVLDLRAASDLGVFDDLADPARAAVDAADLGPLLTAGRPAWIEVRRRLGELLVDDASDAERLATCLHDVGEVELLLPFPVADFVDFYSSLDHASNIGRMFRPHADPLLPNWRHLPVGYHGRSGTVVVTGTPVIRPHGQRLDASGDVVFGPTEKLDIELEVGFVLGGRSQPGHPIPTSAVRDHVFGVVLVNDWSARDIQSWEYVPLGPFLGKSFATSISGWVVSLDALEPFRVPGPRQEPEVLPYLRCDQPWGLAIELSVDLRVGGRDARTIVEVGFDATYWTAPQQLAHLTVNGATVRPGDLFASGTVSGPTRRERGSLIELTWNGTDPLDLGDGVTRRFLEDGDEVTLRGRCATEGHPAIGLGEVTGAVRGRAR